MIFSLAAILTGEIILLCVRCYLRFIGLPKVLARICAKAGLEDVASSPPSRKRRANISGGAGSYDRQMAVG
jgi:hypothetical protein